MDGQPKNAGIFGLATCKADSTGCHHPDRWALTPPSHPYPVVRTVIFFSATVPSRIPPSQECSALCCPDFPFCNKQNDGTTCCTAKLHNSSVYCNYLILNISVLYNSSLNKNKTRRCKGAICCISII